MYVVRVKYRGRDLVTHTVERAVEARQLRRVYELLGYDADKIIVERRDEPSREAA
ncbi:MAG TPA: hypothetical protein VFB58_00015 [Chloroflexota bacterium]|nr:hypothetical protein [Chloroflexota bacterium]